MEKNSSIFKIVIFLLGIVAVLAVFYFVFFGGGKQVAQSPTINSGNEDDQEIDDMTDAEKQAAMEEALAEQPFEDMSDAEKEQEQTVANQLQDAGEAVVSGSFVTGAHETSGKVTLVEENGVRKLMFDEMFASDSGPQLHVFLSGSESPDTSAELHAVGDADLGKLKSLSGVQVYELPADLGFTPKSVVIYCVPFRVVFGFADLK